MQKNTIFFCICCEKLYLCKRKTKESSLKQGQLPEWPNGADCNSAGVAFGGSNPSLPTNYFAEIAQSIEHQPSKLGVAGLSPVFRSLKIKQLH